MSLFRTRNQGLAAALRYSLGPAAHLRTFREERGVTFLFDDSGGECAGISSAFFSDHGEGGFAVGDAKVLIDNFIEVRRTMTASIGSPTGQWPDTGEIAK